MKYYIICDCREQFPSSILFDTEKKYNDHPSQKNLQEIMDAMTFLGYDCEYFGGIPELIHAVDKHMSFHDCAFINFTDGLDQNYSRVQAPALLDMLGVPYSGSGVFSSVLMNNKHYCKQALQGYGILMPNSHVVNKHIPFNISWIKKWKYPLFVKPNCEGSSIGISKHNVCHSDKEVYMRVESLLNDFDEIIVEEFVTGKDVTNFMIGNSNNYLLNDVVTAELFDSSPFAVYGVNEKCKKLRKLYINTEKVDENILLKIKNTSVKIATIIGANDICRIDYRYDTELNRFYFLEINSAPRFSSTSEIGFIAQKRDMTFSAILNLYIKTFTDRILKEKENQS